MAPAGRLLALLARPRGPACAGTMAQPPRFALELPGCGLAHFAVGADPDAGPGPGPDPGPDARAAALLGPPGRCYALCVPVAPGRGCAGRVRAARLLQRLLPQLRRGPLARCQLRRLLRYRPGGGAAGLQRGVLLRDPEGGPDARRALLALLDSCLEAPRPSLSEFVGDAGQRLWQRAWELRGGREWRQADPERVVCAPEPALHPAVPDLPGSGVFPHREAARAVLEAVSGPGSEEERAGRGAGLPGPRFTLGSSLWGRGGGLPAALPRPPEGPAARPAHPDAGHRVPGTGQEPRGAEVTSARGLAARRWGGWGDQTSCLGHWAARTPLHRCWE